MSLAHSVVILVLQEETAEEEASIPPCTLAPIIVGRHCQYRSFQDWFWLEAKLDSVGYDHIRLNGETVGLESWLCCPATPQVFLSIFQIWMRCIDKISFQKSFIFCYTGLPKTLETKK